MADKPKRDIEAILAARKKKTAIWDIIPVTDAVMLHYVMNVLYTHFLKEHTLRADWQPNILLSSRAYLARLPKKQIVEIGTLATIQANHLFEPVLAVVFGVDIRHMVVAFAQVVVTLVDQHRYNYTEDALVLQSLGIINEAIEDRAPDWNYDAGNVNSIYAAFMKGIDNSEYFRREGEREGSAMEVLH